VKHRTRSAMQHMKAKGAVVGSVPYGYRRCGDQLEEEPAEQTIIVEVNRLYRSRKTLSEICRALKEQGQRTRNGNPFSLMQVKRIIGGYEDTYKRKATEMGSTIKGFIQKVA
jgi:DNA invertase Pin-like site-specific DNA recombinase